MISQAVRERAHHHRLPKHWQPDRPACFTRRHYSPRKPQYPPAATLLPWGRHRDHPAPRRSAQALPRRPHRLRHDGLCAAGAHRAIRTSPASSRPTSPRSGLAIMTFPLPSNGLPRLAVLPWRAGIPIRVGPNSQGRGFAHNLRVACPPGRSEAELYLTCAEALDVPTDGAAARYETSATDVQRAEELLASHGVSGNPSPSHPAPRPPCSASAGPPVASPNWPRRWSRNWRPGLPPRR